MVVLYERAKEETLYPPIQVEAEFDLQKAKEKGSLERDMLFLEKNTVNLRKFNQSLFPNLNRLLQRLDLIYIYEVNALTAYLSGNSNLEDYKINLLEEQAISQEVRSLFKEIDERNINFANILKRYYKFVKDQGLTIEILVAIISIILIKITLFVVGYWYLDKNDEDIMYVPKLVPYIILYSGIFAFIITTGTHVFLKGRHFYTLIKKTMI